MSSSCQNPKNSSGFLGSVKLANISGDVRSTSRLVNEPTPHSVCQPVRRRELFTAFLAEAFSSVNFSIAFRRRLALSTELANKHKQMGQDSDLQGKQKSSSPFSVPICFNKSFLNITVTNKISSSVSEGTGVRY